MEKRKDIGRRNEGRKMEKNRQNGQRERIGRSVETKGDRKEKRREEERKMDRTDRWRG